MSESSVGTAGVKDKARLVQVILGSILVAVLCGIVVGAISAWPLGMQKGLRLGIYVSIGVVVFALVLQVWGLWLHHIGKVFTERACPNLSPPGHGPRNHIICLDGTWNLPTVKTNVWKLYKRLVQDPEKQIAHYYPGVGTRELTGARSAFVAKYFSTTLFEGTTAYGSSGALSILRRTYFDFVKYYQPEDRIYIFGFSRGAAIARALANYICTIYGLRPVEIKYLKSRIQKEMVIDLTVAEEVKSSTPPIVFLGLWDTVASIGNPYNKREPFELTIAPGVEKVLHLVAIDEQRKAFDVKANRPE